LKKSVEGGRDENREGKGGAPGKERRRKDTGELGF